MATWIRYVNFAAAASGVTAALLGLLLAATAPYVRRQERRYFVRMFLLLLAYVTCDFVGQASQYFLGPPYAWLARASVFLELLFSAAILPLFGAYLLNCTGEDWRSSMLRRVELALFAAYAAVLVVAQFGDAVYYFSVRDQCVFAGPYFFALVVPPLTLMLLNLIAFVRRNTLLTARQRAAFAACTALPLVSTLLQAGLFGLSVLVVGVSVSALAMFSLILADQIEAHTRETEEAAQRRTQVLALQMRPHFIYNVMSSIYYLCAQDPTRAQQVTLDFITYLRANFSSVVSEDEVPFAKELEHVRAYVAVERARLGDGLHVQIECPCTTFRLPPLTLQPLVENAIKHGADPEMPPLWVRVSTHEEPGRYVVTVEDTGPGLPGDVFTDDPTSVLANIRERLATHGSELHIQAREGGGTVATIHVPTQYAGENERLR